MDPENRNLSQPQPEPQSGPQSEPQPEPQSGPQPGPQLDPDLTLSDAPLATSLPSMMKSLTPNAPVTSGDAAPQYPSLEAAVEIEQQVAPTLTNLLAAKTPTPPHQSLGIVQASATAEMPIEDADQISSDKISAESAPAPPPREEESPAASQDSVTAKGLLVETSETQLPTQPEMASDLSEDGEGDEGRDGDEGSEGSDGDGDSDGDGEAHNQGDGEAHDPDNDDFDQVKTGATKRDRTQQVRIKREETHVAVIFPKEEASANPDVAVEFIDSQLWQDLQQRLSGGIEFANDTPVHLYSQNCLLDTRQLQELDEALGRFNLKLVRIITSRRQTAVAAAMSGYSTDQTKELPELLSKEIYSPQKIGLAEPLYLQKNIRSGTEICHPGSVIVMGDLNPGSSVIADGDILVWGKLRGIAHAGAAGNQSSIVMALKLEAPQLRIAGAVARVDAQSKSSPSPEIAYISGKSIRITSAYGFNRNALE